MAENKRHAAGSRLMSLVSFLPLVALSIRRLLAVYVCMYAADDDGWFALLKPSSSFSPQPRPLVSCCNTRGSETYIHTYIDT